MAPRRDFGTTWWGRAWVDALERAGPGYESRLPRGRTYARKGAVRELEVRPGHIAARVVGRTGELYRVDIAVRTLADSEWDQVTEAIAARASHLAALLDGELDPGIVDDAEAVDVQLLPRASDLRPDCTCPDWAEPCKHAAAVCYMVATELDRDPFTLFLLRGIERDELIARVRAHRSGVEAAAGAAPARPEGVLASAAWEGHRLDGPPSAPPPELPPAVRVTSCGFRTGPQRWLSLSVENARSQRFDLPSRTAPARSSARCAWLDDAGTRARYRHDPPVVGIPAVSHVSLRTYGTPRSGRSTSLPLPAGASGSGATLGDSTTCNTAFSSAFRAAMRARHRSTSYEPNGSGVLVRPATAPAALIARRGGPTSCWPSPSPSSARSPWRPSSGDRT